MSEARDRLLAALGTSADGLGVADPVFKEIKSADPLRRAQRGERLLLKQRIKKRRTSGSASERPFAGPEIG